MVIIVLLFPESTKFRYEYSEGRPWLYEDLESPVDFAIKKTDSEIERELKNEIQGLVDDYESMKEALNA